jgi:hypothetical protein
MRRRAHHHASDDWKASSESEIPEGRRAKWYWLMIPGVRRVAQAICDPHKETGCAAAFRVPGVEGDQKGKRDPRESEEFSLNFSQP